MIKIGKSKKALMDALIYLMAEKPIQAVKITEICAYAECNRSTFYSNYESKEDLLEDLLKVNIQELNGVLEQVAIDLHRKKTYNALLPLFQYIFDNRYFYNIVLGDYKVTGFRQILFDSYKGTIAKKIAEEIDLIQGDSILLELQLNHIASTWLGVALYWVYQNETMSVEYVTSEYIKIINLKQHKIFSNEWRYKRRRAQNTDKKKKVIEIFQRALIRLLQERDYKQIKVQDILNEAVYNRSSFYQNFKDKDDLYKSIRDEFFEGMLYSLTNTGAPSIRSFKALSPIESLMHYLYENRAFLKVMYGQHSIPGFFNQMFTIFTDFFEQELQSRKNFEIDTALYSNFLMNTIMVVVGGWFTKGIRYSPEFMAKILISLIDE